jgi:hypothetical protein
MIKFIVKEEEPINIKFKSEHLQFKVSERPLILNGTDNYNDLINKPTINGKVLEGDKTSSDLGLNTVEAIYLITLSQLLN